VSVSAQIVGREKDADAVRALLESSRLVTILGPGGVGKTTLARQLMDGQEAIFVPLDEVQGDSVKALIQESLGLDQGADLFTPQKVLIVLDNAEHVIESAQTVVAQLLDAPEVRVLVTSRERLGLSAEEVFELPVLDHDSAIELFVARAQDVDPKFSPSPGLMRLIELLDRLPLALELAAARVRVVSVEDMEIRLAQVLRRARGPKGRHESIDACIAWSVDMLDAEEKQALSRSALPNGPFTIEDAELLFGTDSWAGDLVESLVEKSLVVRIAQEEQVVFSLLDCTRRWCRQHLPALEDADEAWLSWVEHRIKKGDSELSLLQVVPLAFEKALSRSTERATQLIIMAERSMRRAGFHEKMMEMLLRAEEGSTGMDLIRIGAAKGSCLLGLRQLVECEEVLSALDLSDVPSLLRARVWQIRGWNALIGGNYSDAVEYFEAALASTESTTPQALIAYIYGGLTSSSTHQKEFARALEYASRAERLTEVSEADRAAILSWKANALAAQGEVLAATLLVRDSVAAYARSEDRLMHSHMQITLTELLLETNSPDAWTTLETVVESMQSASWLPRARAMALEARVKNDVEKALGAVVMARNLADHSQRPIVLNTAIVLAKNGRTEEARAYVKRLIDVTEGDEQDWLKQYDTAFLGKQVAADDFDERYLRCEYGFPPSPRDFLASSAVDHPTLEIQDATFTFNGVPHDLTTRHTLRRILHTLLDAHKQEPGRCVTMEELLAGGWPQEVMTYESGSQRVYAAIKQIRKLGLGDLVQTGESGYLIAAATKVTLSE